MLFVLSSSFGFSLLVFVVRFKPVLKKKKKKKKTPQKSIVGKKRKKEEEEKTKKLVNTEKSETFLHKILNLR